ncbi:hypothetical protein [Pontibacter oryzae]|uniref:hypothetical protein n=1 Tax=Pontibacter oryzae TaxID=2304593 RepID=UPI0011C45F4E|nr:hypothetical protein [Pontibacter oryzae]
MKKHFILPALLCLLCLPQFIRAQSKIKAAVNFTYQPNPDEDQYNPRLPHKSIAVGPDAFVTLNHSTGGKYTLTKYTTELKQLWSAGIPLAPEETVEAFAANLTDALVVTRQLQGQNQVLQGYRINLKTGQHEQPVQLLQAPAKGRRAGVAISSDGSKVLAFRYLTDNSFRIQQISGTLYTGSLQAEQDVMYNLRDVAGILTADIQLANTGEQYLSLISDEMNRLTVRKYSPGSKQAKVMSVLVGGVFDGQKVYIRDTRFKLMDNGLLYGAVLTAEEKGGAYHSLKAVKYDFENEDMVFAEEFRFSPDYVRQVNALDKSSNTKLHDIYLTDLFLTPEQRLVLVAEQKYTEGGDNAPYVAKELHLFAYDRYMNHDWSSVLMKQQQAPASEGFSGISYSPNLQGNTLSLLTLETLSGKYDLYFRQIDTATGKATAPQSLNLGIPAGKNLAYLKAYTTWLTEKDIIAVIRSGKKDTGLQLSRIQIK